MLEWKANDPAPDPIEAAFGDATTYRVHFATCIALEEEDLLAALTDVFNKCLSFAPAEINDRAERLVFLWDVGPGILTAVYTDESMDQDAMEVTKCQFKELPESHFDGITDQDDLGTRMRGMLEEVMAQVDLSVLPPQMMIYFSEKERSDYTLSDFPVHQLNSR